MIITLSTKHSHGPEGPELPCNSTEGTENTMLRFGEYNTNIYLRENTDFYISMYASTGYLGKTISVVKCMGIVRSYPKGSKLVFTQNKI